jgi:hypothetical protein
MNASDWADHLVDPEAIRRFFAAPPALETCDLFYFHVDERDRAITAGFNHHGLPDHSSPEWSEKGFNAFEFFLTFAGTSGLRIAGWEHTGMDHYTFSPGLLGGLPVTMSGQGQRIDFQAESVSLTRLRAFTAVAL